MTTGATLSGPSLASWFLDRKLGEGYKDTLDQSDWCLMFLCNQAWISLLRLPEPKASRKTVLKVNCFSEASFKGSKGALVSWCNTRERFQEGIPLLPLGLSLWKLSRRRGRFSSLLTLWIHCRVEMKNPPGYYPPGKSRAGQNSKSGQCWAILFFNPNLGKNQ